MSIKPSSELLIQEVNNKGMAEDLWILQQEQAKQGKQDPRVLQEIIGECQRIQQQCRHILSLPAQNQSDSLASLERAFRYVIRDTTTLSETVQKRLSEITPMPTAQAAAPRLDSRVTKAPSPTQAQARVALLPTAALAPAPASREVVVRHPQLLLMQPGRALQPQLREREPLERKSPSGVKGSDSDGGEDKFHSPFVADGSTSEEEFFAQFHPAQPPQTQERAEMNTQNVPSSTPKQPESRDVGAKTKSVPDLDADFALALKLSQEEEAEPPRLSPITRRKEQDRVSDSQRHQRQQPQHSLSYSTLSPIPPREHRALRFTPTSRLSTSPVSLSTTHKRRSPLNLSPILHPSPISPISRRGDLQNSSSNASRGRRAAAQDSKGGDDSD